jgi:hypothetical protein
VAQAEGREGEATCKAARVEGAAGVLATSLRPFALECALRWPQAGAAEQIGSWRLEGRAAAAGTRQERHGRLRSRGGAEFDIRSVHRVEGSPLPLEAPFGYLLSRGGAPVAAVELNGLRPRLWRPGPGGEGDGAARDDLTVALVALALFRDPAR